MTDDPHDHARPALADQRAALAAARALLTSTDPDTVAHAAAQAGTCPACTAIAGISLGIGIVSELAGDGPLVSQRTRLAVLAAVKTAEAALREAPN